MNDFSKSLAEVAAALASLCLALLALSVPTPDVLITIPWLVRILLSGAGTALLVAAAFLVDWTIDSFSEADWPGEQVPEEEKGGGQKAGATPWQSARSVALLSFRANYSCRF
jgi:hypothetical protein